MLSKVIDGVWCLDDLTDEELRVMVLAEAKWYPNPHYTSMRYNAFAWN